MEAHCKKLQESEKLNERMQSVANRTEAFELLEDERRHPNFEGLGNGDAHIQDVENLHKNGWNEMTSEGPSLTCRSDEN
jgi:hypothetical protein